MVYFKHEVRAFVDSKIWNFTKNGPFWAPNYKSWWKIKVSGDTNDFGIWNGLILSFYLKSFSFKNQNFDRKLTISKAKLSIFDQKYQNFDGTTFLVPSIKFNKIVGFLFCLCISVFTVFPVVFLSSVEFFWCVYLFSAGDFCLTEFRGRRLRTDKRKLKMIDAFTRVSYRGPRIIYS